MANTQSYPLLQALDDNGYLLTGGLLYSYRVGTSTPRATYSDSDLNIANTNPVTLNSRGEATIYLSGPTDLILKDRSGATVWGPITCTTEEDSGSEAYLDTQAFGAQGIPGHDDGPSLQAAIDAAEDTATPILVSTDLYINSTVYIGNAPLFSYGRTIYIVADANFTRLGTGTYRTAGAILTKASAGAGYGISNVTLDWDNINLSINKTSSAHLVRTSLFLDNASGSIRNTKFTTAGTVATTEDIVPLDLYAGVTDLNIDNCKFYLNFTGGHGGTWVRNFDAANPTQNINFNNVVWRTTQADEAVAVFTPVANTIVENVNFNNCQVFYNSTQFPVAVYSAAIGSIVRNVNFDNCQVDCSGTGGVIGMYEVATLGTCTNINITNSTVTLIADNSSQVVAGIKGFDRAENTKVRVVSYAGTENICAYYNCGQLINCENTFDTTLGDAINYAVYSDTEMTSAVNCKFNGFIYNCVNLSSSQITGSVMGCRRIADNKITIPASMGDVFPIMCQDGYTPDGPIWIENNLIVDEGISSYPVISLTKVADYYIRDNSYIGNRTQWEITTRTNIIVCDNNTIFSPIYVLGGNTSYCASTQNPWSDPTTGYFIMPVGHRVWNSGPLTSTDSPGWVKIADSGSAKANWATMAVLSAIP